MIGDLRTKCLYVGSDPEFFAQLMAEYDHCSARGAGSLSEVDMQLRGVLAIVPLILLPAAAQAQGTPHPDPRRPDTLTTSLPPQPQPIARQIDYLQRPVTSRLTVAAYPIASVFAAPGIVRNGNSTWTSAGVGTRLDYAFTPNVSATLDMTFSAFGGPAITSTAELGTRLHRAPSFSKWYPFFDLRLAYIAALSRDHYDLGGAFQDPSQRSVYDSHGVGAIGGVGTEYALTTNLSLTTDASVMMAHLMARNAVNGSVTNHTFGMAAVRYTLGLSYNRGRNISSHDASRN